MKNINLDILSFKSPNRDNANFQHGHIVQTTNEQPKEGPAGGWENGDQEFKNYVLAKDKIRMDIRPLAKYEYIDFIAYALNIGDSI